LAQSFSVNLQTNQRSFGKSSQSSQCLEADQNQDSAEAAASPARRTTRRASSSWSRLKMPSVRSAHSSWPATSGGTPAFYSAPAFVTLAAQGRRWTAGTRHSSFSGQIHLQDL